MDFVKQKESKECTITIYDIASEAGVSITTVSRVLNTPEKVSRATRKRVESILKKYNYSPNDMARGLVYNSMKTVGILVTDIRNQHFSTSAYILEDMFFNFGYTTLLCNTGEDVERKIKYIQILSGKKADGLVLLGSVYSGSEIEQMINNYMPRTPIITSNNRLSIPNGYSVLIDHNYSMELAITHLMQRGHKEFCFIHSNDSYNTHRKEKAFIQVIQNKGLVINPDKHLYHAEHGPIGGRNFADFVLDSKISAKAFIFMDDYTAIGAVSQFRKRGARIPEDFAIVGHDNSTFAICSEPQLTTIDTRIEAMSRVMANTLHDIFQKKEVGTTIMLRPDLIIREST